MAVLPRTSLPAVPASNTRRWVIVFAVSLATVQYIDRVAISQAMPYIGADLGLTDGQKGMVFSAFTLALARTGVAPNHVVALGTVFLPELWLVFPCHVAADVSSGRTRNGYQIKRPHEMAG